MLRHSLIEDYFPTLQSNEYQHWCEVYDDAPTPGTSGHEAVYKVENCYKYNVPYGETDGFFITNDGNKPNASQSNVTSTRPDFSSAQVSAKNLQQNMLWNNLGLASKNPIAPASAKYNCHAYALGKTDVWVHTNKHFIKSGHGGNPADWHALGVGDIPDRAGHGYREHDHSSIVSYEEHYSIDEEGNPVSYVVETFTGKFSECGVYKTELPWVDCEYPGYILRKD